MTRPFSDVPVGANVVLRLGRMADAEDINRLYNWYIENTPITFDIDPIPLERRQKWMEQFDPAGRHQLVVAESDGEVVGYAASLLFREKAAYATSVETSIYVNQTRHRRGVGRALYGYLFDLLAKQDVHRAFAGITQPNEASEALHVGFGFEPIGDYHEVGRKFGRYWDVRWYQKALR